MDPSKHKDESIAQSAMAKAMWRILPLILLAYIVAYMDRVNVSFAALQMNDDLKFSATIYGLGGGLFFLGYALFEVPSSLMLARFSAPQWMARIMITWGLLAASMMFVRTPIEFYVLRFLLGVAEAGFMPCVIFYYSSWFPMAWRGRAVSRMYIAPSLASIVMGGISGVLLDLDGSAGLRGWQWLFLVQGLPAAFMGLIILRYLPAAPATVSWLEEPEKTWLQQAIARDAAVIGAPVRHNLLAALASPKVLLLGAVGFLGNGAAFGLLLSAPELLRAGTGLSASSVGYLVSVGGIVGVLCVLLAGWNSDRTGDRLRDAAICSALMVVGFLAIGLSAAPVAIAAGYLLLAATGFAGGGLMVTSWADVLPARELAVGSAAINTLWQLGSFLSPYVWGVLKDATGDYRTGLVAGSILIASQCLLILYLRARVRSERRARALEQAFAPVS